MLIAVVPSLVVQNFLWWYNKIFPPLHSSNFNETDVITNIVVLHMSTNDIINSEVNRNLIADSISNIAGECVAFGVKSVFISNLMVNNRRN